MSCLLCYLLVPLSSDLVVYPFLSVKFYAPINVNPVGGGGGGGSAGKGQGFDA